MQPNGVPCIALGYVSLDAAGLNLIESKSFKLYLNSFNQTVFASADDVRRTLEQDLSACAQGKVTVELLRRISSPDKKSLILPASVSIIRILRLLIISSAVIILLMPSMKMTMSLKKR